MSLLEEIDKAIRSYQTEVEQGYPEAFAAPVKRLLEKWRGEVVRGHYDEDDRHRDAGAAFRLLSDSLRVLELPFSQTVLDIADRYVRNDI
jgi:hypothetical protein